MPEQEMRQNTLACGVTTLRRVEILVPFHIEPPMPWLALESPR